MTIHFKKGVQRNYYENFIKFSCLKNERLSDHSVLICHKDFEFGACPDRGITDTRFGKGITV